MGKYEKYPFFRNNLPSCKGIPAGRTFVVLHYILVLLLEIFHRFQNLWKKNFGGESALCMRILKGLFLTKRCPGEKKRPLTRRIFPLCRARGQRQMKPGVRKNPWLNRICMPNIHSVQFGSWCRLLRSKGTRINNPRLTMSLPIQALSTAVTIARIFTLQRNFAPGTNIKWCVTEDHYLWYEHRYLKLRSFENESDNMVLPKQFQTKENCLFRNRCVFFVPRSLSFVLRHSTNDWKSAGCSLWAFSMAKTMASTSLSVLIYSWISCPTSQKRSS